MRLRALMLLLVAAACDRDNPPTPQRNLQPPRRIIEPPTTGIVRAMPPHAIRADGVGPYKIGDKVAALLQQLPSGPRIMRFEIPGIVRTSVIRAEEDTVVIGGETASNVTFVGVVGSEVARTEKGGVHVGSSIDELEAALGSAADDADRARDPHLVVPQQQRNLLAVIDSQKITALVVTAEPATRTALEASCTLPEAPADSQRRVFPACLTPAGELVEVDADEVLVKTAEGKTASVRIPNLVFAEPLRNLADNRDEIAAITVVENAQERAWSIVAYRLEGTRLVRSLDSEVIYEISNARTRWIGSELRDVHVYLELASQADGIEVGGLLTTHAGDKIRDVAVISPILVGRKSAGKSATTEPSNGSAPGSGGNRVDAGSANP